MDQKNNHSYADILSLFCLVAGGVGLFFFSVRSLQTDLPFVCGALGILFFASCLWMKQISLFQSKRESIFAGFGLWCALCLRMSLFNHISLDYTNFLSGWVSRMRGMSAREVLITPIGNYNMPYMYLLLLISRLPVSDLYAIKIFSVVFDVVCAAAGAHIALICGKEKYVLPVFFMILFAPTSWLNSAFWGQCDSVYTAMCMMCLLSALDGKPKRSIIWLGLAFSFKLQTVFFLPVIFILLAGRYINLKNLILFPVVFLFCSLPALLAGRSFYDTFSIYSGQVTIYPYLSLNAPSLWSLIPNEYYDELSSASLILAGGGIIILSIWILQKAKKLTGPLVVSASLLYSLAMPWLLPKMHERYFYLAEMLSIVWAAGNPHRLPVSLLLLFGGFLVYSLYLFGGMPILSLQWVAVLYGLLILILIWDFKHEAEICK